MGEWWIIRYPPKRSALFITFSGQWCRVSRLPLPSHEPCVQDRSPACGFRFYLSPTPSLYAYRLCREPMLNPAEIVPATEDFCGLRQVSNRLQRGVCCPLPQPLISIPHPGDFVKCFFQIFFIFLIFFVPFLGLYLFNTLVCESVYFARLVRIRVKSPRHHVVGAAKRKNASAIAETLSHIAIIKGYLGVERVAVRLATAYVGSPLSTIILYHIQCNLSSIF